MATKNSGRKSPIISPPAISKLGDDDLLAEVLCGLPDTRSAWRCKSVCKRWNSLISAPYFPRRFLSHHRNRPAVESEPPLLITPAVRGPIWSFLPLPGDDIPFDASVVDCFRDLLLIELADRSVGLNRDDEELSRTFLVCNPFTKQWVALPLAPKIGSRKLFARLVCKPCNLGVAGREEEEPPLTHHSEYRFLVVRPQVSKLDVFCSVSGEWKELALDAPIPQWPLNRNVISLNGKLHWKARDKKLVVGLNTFSRLDDDVVVVDDVVVDDDDVDPGLTVGIEYKSRISSSQGALYMIYPAD